MYFLALCACLSFHEPSADAWPGFRGYGDSTSAAASLPVSWELRGRGRSGWNVRLPGYGQSSPVVWKDRVFVTSVSGDQKEHLHVLAFRLDDGEKLWQRDFAGTQNVADSDAVSRGAPTPVVDAERLYAVFESGDIVALTHDGETAWQRSFVADYGEIKGPHGYASSPVLCDDLLIVQVCHSGPSYVLALDRRTGANRWKTDHPPETGWSTPAVIRQEGVTAVVISTSGSVRAYETAGGRELWSVTGTQGNSTASPSIAGEYVVIGAGDSSGGGPGSRGARPNEGERTAPFGAAGRRERPSAQTEGADDSVRGSLAIRLGGSGDVSGSHVVWKTGNVTTGYASPLVVGPRAYFVNRAGVVQCVDVPTGTILWQHRLPGQVWASPVANNGHLFFFCKEGQVVVLKNAAAAVPVAESTISATDIVYGVAAVENSWIVRTGRGLIRIAGTAPAPQPAGVP
jgi:outer membrane protein assembly factor BamB